MRDTEQQQEHQNAFHDNPKVPLSPGDTKPFATRSKQHATEGIAQNKVAVIAAAAIVVAIALFLLASKPKPAHKQSGPKQPPRSHVKAESGEGSTQAKGVSPLIDSSESTNNNDRHDLLAEDDVHRTATHPPSSTSVSQAAVPKGTSLGALPPFEPPQNTWQALPYNSASANSDLQRQGSKNSNDDEQSALVFVRKAVNRAERSSADSADIDVLGLPLPPGTRLRARLETAASTAVRTPVIAVIEYNYEKNGEIIIPAGSKCFGHIEQADRSGYVSIRFESLNQPDGSSVDLDAVATDLTLGPLRGKVEGKNTGKNVAVRSLSGLGEVGALLAGRGGTFNQPFSETDLLRECVSNNIGTSADQELTRLAVTEHIVVSLAANTPIYVILDRATHGTNSNQTPNRQSTASQIDSLRQLLQLQRELNETAAMTR